MSDTVYIRDLWYKNSVIYVLDVATFQDSNGDGIGDFRGLIAQLDYLASLGVTCLWLLPFYPTPNGDDGYDITDFYSVDPRLGTLGDFVDFMHQAAEVGLRVLVDYVPTHTSSEHPWFKAARNDRLSQFRDYYVWTDDRPKNMTKGIVFPGEQKAVWTFDQETDSYYHHYFYDFEPDLNLANVEVRDEMRKVMGLWLDLGISGFRVDAIPFAVWLRGMDPNVKDPYEYVTEMHDFMARRRGNTILLAEANLPTDELSRYFASGDRMQMLFNFPATRNIWLALAEEKAEPIARAFRNLPHAPLECQWANFMRVHDEIDLEHLSDKEREKVFEVFAPEQGMRYLGRGIRRRVAPMMDGDRRKMELAYSLLLSLPGTPVILYGAEIGMGDDLSLQGRMSVRTPMQWSSQQNAGFSHAATGSLVRPVVDEGKYSYRKVNVAVQRNDPNSFFNWMERMIRLRRANPELGWGNWNILETGNPAVLAHSCVWEGNAVVVVHNLSGKTRDVTLDLGPRLQPHLFDMLKGQLHEPQDGGNHHFRMPEYGYRWFRTRVDGSGPGQPGSF